MSFVVYDPVDSEDAPPIKETRVTKWEERAQERARLAEALAVWNGEYNARRFQHDFVMNRSLAAGALQALGVRGAPWWKNIPAADTVWIHAATHARETLARWMRRDSREEVDWELDRLARKLPVTKLMLFLVNRPDHHRPGRTDTEPIARRLNLRSGAERKKFTIIDTLKVLLEHQAVHITSYKPKPVYRALTGPWDLLWAVDENPLQYAQALALKLYFLLKASKVRRGRCQCGRWFMDFTHRKKICDKCVQLNQRALQTRLTKEKRDREHAEKIARARRVYQRLAPEKCGEWQTHVSRRTKLTRKFLTQNRDEITR